MTKLLAVFCLPFALLAGCARDAGRAATTAPAGGMDEAIATFRGTSGGSITREQFDKLVTEAYGLSVMVDMVRLELVRQHAAERKVTISPEDIEQERRRQAKKLLNTDDLKNYQADLEFAFKRFRGRAEMELTAETDAYLRKMAEAQVADKITDDNLRHAFWIMYGAKVEVEHVQCDNMQEIAEALRRVNAGQSFEQVAHDLSRNPWSWKDGGRLPTFTINSPDVPEAFRKMAFLLKDGDVSEPVAADGAFHLIKMLRHIEPKAVKFEDVKESIRTQMHAQLVDAATEQLRAALSAEMTETLTVYDPILARQYAREKDRQSGAIKDRDEIRRAMEAERARVMGNFNPATTSTTGPSTAATRPLTPATGPTPPTRPPATMPGE